MKDILAHYQALAKTIAQAPTGHVPALDRLVAHSQAAIATEQAQRTNTALLEVIKTLILPGGCTTSTRNHAENELLAALSAAQDAVSGEEAKGGGIHPSPFSAFDPDSPEIGLSPEDQQADAELKNRIARDVQSHWDREFGKEKPE